ncbi:hypothetical protein HMPREF1624_00196 [Sporothrix schenckii ATCC 58251]|uniref:BSD domain-containing protein n=1 Tax=Sporothrix schenckii (strain ATCC 58251 / de Perez 2211183) TaxID=1391915 RepID=U7Q5C7_SPOS1|nr:hypothetical protein HMPREF1624_00196 [Sporothrix schenckii ATCC 58251]
MDLAYDEITRESLPEDGEGRDHSHDQPPATINEDLQAAVSALSPWATRIGGFFGNVVKQGGSVVREAQLEVTALGQDASKGLTGLRDTLVSHTRNLSLVAGPAGAGGNGEGSSSAAAAGASEGTPTATDGAAAGGQDETVLTKIKGEAAKRLRDLQRAEDAADEALIKFGTGLRDFLREAITIAPPTAGASAAGGSGPNTAGSTVLFESKDAQGKRVIHTSRFDAQLHVIHTSPDSFAKDPSGGDEFAAFAKTFNIDSKTADIASDLNKYPELRATMEKLVPATVPYTDFWKRYYFLRRGIETAEARRRDLLKAASAEEEVAWDEDSDEEDSDEDSEEDSDEDESDTESEETKATGKATGKAPARAPAKAPVKGPAKAPANPPAKQTGSAESSKTLQPPKKTTTKATAAKKVSSTPSVDGLLKPSASPRKSDEKSVADSEASYDIVGAKSGAPSQAPNSPQRVEEDSEEEDWE